MNTDSTTPVDSAQLALTTTTRNPFYRIGPTNPGLPDQHLFEVMRGVDPMDALPVADGLDESVRELLHVAVREGLDSPTSFLCLFAMQASSAIRASVGAVA